MWKRFVSVVFIIFCVELGLFLLVLPWSDLWDQNGFLHMVPTLRPILLSNFARGAVSGLGLLNLWVAMSDIWNFRRIMATLEARDTAQRATEVAAAPAVEPAPKSGKNDKAAPNPLLHN